jgi:hypothetical protein
MKGNGLRGTPAFAGLLVLLLFGLVRAQAKDVWLYKVTKGIHYQQPSSAVPTVLSENGYVFQANVFLTAPGNASGATVVSQEGTVRTLTFDNPDELEFRNRVNTKATLEGRYPDGNFRLTIHTAHDGTRSLTLPLLGNTYPNAPYVDNMSGLQAQNANGYIVVTWQPLGGGTANDFIQLRIEDSTGAMVWETDDLGEEGALDGTSTFAIIKAGNLRPSTRYQATLLFEKSCGTDWTSYTGALGWSTYHARTEFTIGTTAATQPDVKTYDVAKGRNFEQTNSAPPTPDPMNEFVFRARVKGQAPGRVTAASLISPNNVSVALMRNTDCGEDFEHVVATNSQAALDAAYAAGVYRLNIQAASQGTRSVALPLNPAEYPPAPRLQFDPLLRIDADRDLHISWDAWPGGTANDFIQLQIEEDDCDNAFETGDFDDKDALDGRATGTVVPAGTLKPGKSYDARLSFHRCVAIDSTSYAGALGQAIYFARTKFKIRTIPPDVKDYEVHKSRLFVQTNSGAPVSTGFVFTATLEAETESSIITAAIIGPNGRTNVLVQQSDGETFRFRDARTTQAALDADYPDGNYVLAISGARDGSRNVPIALTGSSYPNAPRLSNYDAAGRINREADFDLRWDAFTGGTASDFIDVEVEETDGDQAFESLGYGKEGALDGLDTSVRIPLGVLAPARMYVSEIYFEKVLRANDAGYRGVDGRVGYASQTYVKIATAGPGNPPALANYIILPDRRFRFNIMTMEGATYQVQGSSNMVNWTTLGTITAATGRFTFTAPPPPARTYFYRARWMR